MISYIKLLGPPIYKGLKALEKIAINMPEVCFMDTMVSRRLPKYLGRDLGDRRGTRAQSSEVYSVEEWTMQYFRSSGVEIPVEKCVNLISKHGEQLGEYDFFFEWFEKPSLNQVSQLIDRIDEKLSKVGCLYSIVTK